MTRLAPGVALILVAAAAAAPVARAEPTAIRTGASSGPALVGDRVAWAAGLAETYRPGSNALEGKRVSVRLARPGGRARVVAHFGQPEWRPNWEYVRHQFWLAGSAQILAFGHAEVGESAQGTGGAADRQYDAELWAGEPSGAFGRDPQCHVRSEEFDVSRRLVAVMPGCARAEGDEEVAIFTRTTSGRRVLRVIPREPSKTRVSIRLAGRYLASHEYGPVARALVVQDWTTGREVLRLSDPGVDTEGYDVDRDGTLAVALTGTPRAAAWTSAQRPGLHRLPGRLERGPVRVAQGRFAYITRGALVVAGRSGRASVVARFGKASNTRVFSFDFDGSRLAWNEQVCQQSRLRVVRVPRRGITSVRRPRRCGR